jgi:hypothetical protein
MLREWERKHTGRLDSIFSALSKVTRSHLLDRQLFDFAAVRATGAPPAEGDTAFDVDGTLVDSQAMIAASLTSAFRAEGLPVPERTRMMSIVGLSLVDAMAARGLRVLVMARRKLPVGTRRAVHADVSQLTFLGLVGMIDPPRSGQARRSRMPGRWHQGEDDHRRSRGDRCGDRT